MKTEIIAIVLYTVILVSVNLFVCHLLLVHRTDTVTNSARDARLNPSLIRHRRSADDEELPLYRPVQSATQPPRSTVHTRAPPTVTTSSNENNGNEHSKYSIELRDTKVVCVLGCRSSRWSSVCTAGLQKVRLMNHFRHWYTSH
jgi:hypothetical protein